MNQECTSLISFIIIVLLLSCREITEGFLTEVDVVRDVPGLVSSLD